MSAIDTVFDIINDENLSMYPFRYCLVDNNKLPFTINKTIAHPNKIEDFCTLDELIKCDFLDSYEGIGISIIASNISAIDIDHCFKEPFDITTSDDRAKYALDLFKDKAYVEFSFSGKGLRILFSINNIENYSEKYYIKNDKTHIEYYQPGNTARYVTLTGKTIYDNSLTRMTSLDTLYEFLNKYMVRPIINTTGMSKAKDNDTMTIEQLMKKVKSYYLKDIEFQEAWFGTAPGSGSNESQMDFHLLKLLYNNIVADKEKLKTIFESSPYFNSKDAKHIKKWEYGNNRYYNYIYERL